MAAVAVDDEPTAAHQQPEQVQEEQKEGGVYQLSEDKEEQAAEEAQDIGQKAPAAENVEQKQVEQDNQTQD